MKPDSMILSRAGAAICLAGLLLASCSSPGTAWLEEHTPGISYEVRIPDPDEARLEVTAHIHFLPREEVALPLEMADAYAFVRLPEPRLEEEIRACDSHGNALPVERLAPYRWSVQTRGNEVIRLDYAVILDHGTLPEVRELDAYEHPYLAADHGLLVAGAIFVVPDVPSLFYARTVFDLPEGWDVWCPWEPDGDARFSPDDRDLLFDDLIAVGHWSVNDLRIRDMEIRLAFAPGQDELERMTVPIIEKIVAWELDLFDMRPDRRYLFLFVDPVMPGTGGSTKSGSMVLTINLQNHADRAPQRIAHLVGHEFFHLWGSARFKCPDELRFFNEGFTDYYAYRASLRAGVHHRQDLAALLEHHMESCEMNVRAGELSLVEAGGELFFSDQPVYNLIYEGGLLAAALLDQELEALGPDRDLDRFMRDFMNDPRWAPKGDAPGLDDFLDLVGEYLPEETADRYADFVAEPHDWNVEAAFRAAGLPVTRNRGKAKPDLRGNLDGTRLRDLDPSGLAFRLGVRAGDRFLEVNGTEPGSAEEVYMAWSAPRSDRIRVKLDRGGSVIHIDVPVPLVVDYTLDNDFIEQRQGGGN